MQYGKKTRMKKTKFFKVGPNAQLTFRKRLFPHVIYFSLKEGETFGFSFDQKQIVNRH
jgi:hypothetical protein